LGSSSEKIRPDSSANFLLIKIETSDYNQVTAKHWLLPKPVPVYIPRFQPHPHPTEGINQCMMYKYGCMNFDIVLLSRAWSLSDEC
jgi:hypothetical protein